VQVNIIVFIKIFKILECRDSVFKKADKAVRKDDKIEVKFEMCEGCFKKNCKSTDILSPYTPKIN